MAGSRVSREEKSSSTITGRCPLCAPRRSTSTSPSQPGTDDNVGHALLVLGTAQAGSPVAGPAQQVSERQVKAIDGVVLTAFGFGIMVIYAQQVKEGLTSG